MRSLSRSLGEQIANQLREDILAGRIAVGEALREVPLAERFGVSRGPVRDALRLLKQEGMLAAASKGGLKVAPPAPDSIRELIMPLRVTIETYALRLVFHDFDEKDFAHWQGVLDRMRLACERRDYPAVAEQDMAFHKHILEQAGQPDLLAIWSTIVTRVRQHFISASETYDDLMDNYVEHEELIKVFREGDLDKAVHALEEHILWRQQ